MPPPASSSRLHVLIAGGGVAGVEGLLALHALAGERIDITLLSQSLELVEGATALGEPFGDRPARRIDLPALATETGARFVHGTLAGVDVDAHTVTTTEGALLSYDVLVMAVGAAPRLPWGRALVLDVTTPRMLEHLRHAARRPGFDRLVIALPPGPHWPLPGYELALLFARAGDARRVVIDLVTPERTPLQVFGPTVSEAVAAELDQAGVRLHAGQRMSLTEGEPVRVRLKPSGVSFGADVVVAVPDLAPHTMQGLPVDARGFLPVDAHGRVSGAPDVYAAGDCAAFPIKHGGLAAQQADSAALHVAARAGAEVTPETTHVVLRARMITGREDLWLRRDLLRPGDPGEVSRHSLWWPPGKVAGRWLSPYLEALADADAGVPHPPARGRTIAPPATDPEPVPIPRDLDLLGDPERSDPALRSSPRRDP